MRFTIQNKIILSNIFIIVLALIIIGTLVIQGMLFYNIQQAESRLIELSNNSNLFIQQLILSKMQDNNAYKTYEENSTFLAEELARQINNGIQLFNQKGELLADSSVMENLPPVEERQEITIAIEQGEKVYVLKKLEEGRFIYFASPIIIEDEQLGVMSILYSLGDVDRLIQQSVTLFISTGILGLFIMYFISFFLSKRILKPVYTLIESSENIASGDYTQQIDYVSHDEIGELTKSFNQMVINIREKIHEINSEKQKLESVLSSINDGVIAVDNDGHILALNDPAKIIFGITEENAFESILSYDFMREVHMETQREQGGMTREVVFDNKHLLIYTNVIHVNKRPIGDIFVLRDITTIRELEEKQRQFISSVSHELRTPLTTVIGYSDLLMRRGIDDVKVVEKSISLIRREGQRLLRLVDDLLNLSKFENIEFDLIKTQVDLIQLLDDVVSQMRVKGKKYKNDIQFNHTDIPKIYGDFDRLKQVFINIIDNSIKYSFPGDIIQIYATRLEDDVLVSIRDFGSGISKEDLDQIFEPFYRVDKVRSRNLGGSGLGLSIVKEIVEKHGGDVSIESQLEEGTLVNVRLPIS